MLPCLADVVAIGNKLASAVSGNRTSCYAVAIRRSSVVFYASGYERVRAGCLFGQLLPRPPIAAELGASGWSAWLSAMSQWISLLSPLPRTDAVMGLVVAPSRHLNFTGIVTDNKLGVWALTGGRDPYSEDSDMAPGETMTRTPDVRFFLWLFALTPFH